MEGLVHHGAAAAAGKSNGLVRVACDDRPRDVESTRGRDRELIRFVPSSQFSVVWIDPVTIPERPQKAVNSWPRLGRLSFDVVGAPVTPEPYGANAREVEIVHGN